MSVIKCILSKKSKSAELGDLVCAYKNGKVRVVEKGSSLSRYPLIGMAGNKVKKGEIVSIQTNFKGNATTECGVLWT